MNRIRIAVLDTGIAKECVDDSVKLRKCIYFDHFDDRLVIADSKDDYNGHGTLCINTMKRICPDLEIYSVDMLGISGCTSNKVFLAALEYAETLDVDIISICASCVVNSHQEQLREVCQRISDSGKLIIASVENGKQISSIADFDTVIGVIGDVMGGYSYTFNRNDEIQMKCDYLPHIVRGKNGLFSKFRGNSRATAIATGIVARFLAENVNVKTDVENILEANQTSADKIYFSKLEDDCEIPFDEETENSLLDTDEDYIRLIFLLCEFFCCEDPNVLRTSKLLLLDDHRMMKNINGLLSLINERFAVEIDDVYMPDLNWAYRIYIKYIKSDRGAI